MREPHQFTDDNDVMSLLSSFVCAFTSAPIDATNTLLRLLLNYLYACPPFNRDTVWDKYLVHNVSKWTLGHLCLAMGPDRDAGGLDEVT